VKKLLELLQQFIPVLVEFPTWLQVFFFLVVFQALLLAFLILVYYIMYIKAHQPPSSTPRISNAEVPRDAVESKAREGARDLDTAHQTSDPNLAATLANLATLYEAQGK
jgi:hypothetical protein